MAIKEFQIYQNKALGAHVIWEFTKSFNDHSNNKKYPTIYHALLILPLCFNKRAVEGIKSRYFREGSLMRAIDDNKDLFSGLQDRMEMMAKLTFQSIYLATQGGLILLDREQMQLVPNSVAVPSKFTEQQQLDYKNMLSASRRLGAWFSHLTIEEISMYFNIKF